jgi:hypothetical protein
MNWTVNTSNTGGDVPHQLCMLVLYRQSVICNVSSLQVALAQNLVLESRAKIQNRPF